MSTKGVANKLHAIPDNETTRLTRERDGRSPAVGRSKSEPLLEQRRLTDIHKRERVLVGPDQQLSEGYFAWHGRLLCAR
jgi:hypothetical protein